MEKDAEARDRIRPVLLLEINEVPWRIIDRYRAGGKCPNLEKFVARSRTWTTVTVDAGHLSPWVTWPSLHRGMPDTDHGVKNLGQDPTTFRGTPIWEEYLNRGLTVGVCGSLQSWPPLPPGKGGFYLPDTFSHDERCIPERLMPFQRFNLGQVRKNGRVVGDHAILNRENLRLAASLPCLGITGRTLASLAAQVIRERFDKTCLARRPVFQSLLFWDIFKSLYRAGNPPAFSSFFTNHVAGIMHRYWHHLFPEDFGDLYRGRPRPHERTMDFAMVVLDRILGEAMAIKQRNPEIVLVFASSMGQNAILRPEHEGYAASVPDLARLVDALGLGRDNFSPLLAMAPHVAVEVPDRALREGLISAMLRSRTPSGERVFKVEEIGDSLSIEVRTPRKAEIEKGGFLISRVGSEGLGFITWKDAGIKMNETDAGTGYHVPEGSLMAFAEGTPEDARTRVEADKVKGMLMEWGGLTPRAEKIRPAALQVT